MASGNGSGGRWVRYYGWAIAIAPAIKVRLCYDRMISAIKARIFYGWVIVFVMATAGAVSMAMGSLNFGLFIKPMGDQLGIGRSWFGWAQTARQASSSVTSPAVGWLIDRYGSRVMLPVSAIVTGGAMIALAYMTDAWHLVALFAIMGLVGMSGPGALVTSVPVLKWFVRDRGKAISYMALGIPIGAMVFVPLTQVFIDEWGWQNAWIILACIGIGVIAPLAAVFVRRQPEDMGLLPDGDAAAASDDAAGGGRDGAPTQQPAVEVSWTVGQALRSPAFWSLVAVFSMVALAIGTVAVHRIADFADRGFNTTLISYATAFDAVCAGAATFAFGRLVRWIAARVLGAVGFALLAIASVMTIYAASDFTMFVSMAIFGLGIGGMMFLQNFIWADYFGREHVGSIRGISMPINLIVGGIGAPIAGYAHDWTGSYNSIWWVGVGLMVCSALLVLVTVPPKPPRAAPPQ